MRCDLVSITDNPHPKKKKKKCFKIFTSCWSKLQHRIFCRRCRLRETQVLCFFYLRLLLYLCVCFSVCMFLCGLFYEDFSNSTEIASYNQITRITSWKWHGRQLSWRNFSVRASENVPSWFIEVTCLLYIPCHYVDNWT